MHLRAGRRPEVNRGPGIVRGPDVVRGPLAALLGAEPPAIGAATSAVRWLFAVAFLVQTGLAMAIGFGAVAAFGMRPTPNALLATVLSVMAFAHLPVGAALAWRVASGAGTGAALGAATTAAVILSVPAWFAALMVASGQRPPFVALVAALVALGYLIGFALTPRFAAAATRPVAGAAAPPVNLPEDRPPTDVPAPPP